MEIGTQSLNIRRLLRLGERDSTVAFGLPPDKIAHQMSWFFGIGPNY